MWYFVNGYKHERDGSVKLLFVSERLQATCGCAKMKILKDAWHSFIRHAAVIQWKVKKILQSFHYSTWQLSKRQLSEVNSVVYGHVPMSIQKDNKTRLKWHEGDKMAAFLSFLQLFNWIWFNARLMFAIVLEKGTRELTNMAAQKTSVITKQRNDGHKPNFQMNPKSTMTTIYFRTMLILICCNQSRHYVLLWECLNVTNQHPYVHLQTMFNVCWHINTWMWNSWCDEAAGTDEVILNDEIPSVCHTITRRCGKSLD